MIGSPGIARHRGALTGAFDLRAMFICAVVAVSGFASFGASAQQNSAKQIYQSSRDSIVVVYALDSKGEPIALGTGFFISDGSTVVTNYHVVKDADAWSIKLSDGGLYSVLRVLAADKEGDVALLQVRAKRKALTLSVKRPEVGDPIVVIGHPRGYENTLSVGIVSSTESSGGLDFQISAPISPGNSGGPVFSEKGAVIGIATASRTNAQNLNFAQSTERITALLSQAMTVSQQAVVPSGVVATAQSTPHGALEPAERPNEVLIEKLTFDAVRISDDAGPTVGLRMSVRNYSSCALGGLSVRAQFKGGPNRTDPFVFQIQFDVDQVVAPGSTADLWYPIKEVSGHGESAPLWNRWYPVMTVLKVHDALCPKG